METFRSIEKLSFLCFFSPLKNLNRLHLSMKMIEGVNLKCNIQFNDDIVNLVCNKRKMEGQMNSNETVV